MRQSVKCKRLEKISLKCHVIAHGNLHIKTQNPNVIKLEFSCFNVTDRYVFTVKESGPFKCAIFID